MSERGLRVVLALTLLGAVGGSAVESVAAEPEKKIEWNLSFGGTVTFAIPSFEDGWSVEEQDDFEFGAFARSSFSQSVRYSPAKPIGGSGSAQLWLPMGLGAFCEVQKATHDFSSQMTTDFSQQARDCAGCPIEKLSVQGQLDTETFERTETRVHFGLGYRLPLGRDSYLEVSGGASRFSLKQDLTRELAVNLDDEDCIPFFLSPSCTLGLDVEKREARKGSSWGFNVGGGFTVFLNKHVGIGGHVRYSKAGDVEVKGLEAIDKDGNEYRTKVRMKTGGVSAGVSLRVRLTNQKR